MKIFHISDLHIGKQLNYYSLKENQKAMFHQIIQMMREHKPDVLIIAGDIFDKSMPSGESYTLFDAFLNDVIGLVALRQAAENAHLDARLAGTRHDLEYLGLGFVLVGTHEPAPIVRSPAVADRHSFARAQAQNTDMLGIPATDDRRLAELLGIVYKKSGHIDTSTNFYLLSHIPHPFSSAGI